MMAERTCRLSIPRSDTSTLDLSTAYEYSYVGKGGEDTNSSQKRAFLPGAYVGAGGEDTNQSQKRVLPPGAYV